MKKKTCFATIIFIMTSSLLFGCQSKPAENDTDVISTTTTIKEDTTLQPQEAAQSDTPKEAATADPEEKPIYITETTGTDNIVFTFLGEGGYYAIKFNGENFGQELYKEDVVYTGVDREIFRNDSVKVATYSRSGMYTELAMMNLYGTPAEYVKFSLDTYKEEKYNGISSYNNSTISVINNEGNLYLIEEVYESGTKAYRCRIKIDSTYDISIRWPDFENTPELANTIFDALCGKIDIYFMPFDENNKPTSAVVSTEDSTSVDMSDWTFYATLLSKYHEAHGIYIKDTTEIACANSTAEKNMAHDGFTVRLVKGSKLSDVYNIAINPISKEVYDSECNNNTTKVDLKAFKNAYAYFSNYYYANYYVETADGYYYNILTTIDLYQHKDLSEQLNTLMMVDEVFIIK